MGAKFTDISDWIVKTWETSGKGSSPLMIVENPETSEVFFFKESHEKYPTEFWSEVITSKYGQLLGFNVLDYNVAYFEGRLGSLSKRMVDTENGETLYHGVEILNDHVDTFKMTSKPICSYQDFKKICEISDFKNFASNIHELILFDALIGNTDRHTENWAFIKKLSAELKLPKLNPEKRPVLWKLAWLFFTNAKKFNSYFENGNINLELLFDIKYSFSPIYDSGCCLGREIQEEKLKDFMNDTNRIDSYIDRGKNEIRWHDDAKGFFELIEILIQNKEIGIKDVFLKISEGFTNDKVKKLVEEIDDEVKIKITETKLTLQRKKFIIKLLIARFEKLRKIIG